MRDGGVRIKQEYTRSNARGIVVRRWRQKAGLAGGELEGRRRYGVVVFECLNA